MRGLVSDESGMATIEAALAIATVVVVVVFAAAATVGVSRHIRCVDAARETARVQAMGDSVRARTVGAQVAPADAEISVRTDGDVVVATVRCSMPLLPGLDVGATAFASREPQSQDAG